MRGILLLILLTATVHGQQIQYGQPEDVGMSSARLGRLDEVVEKTIQEQHIPGAVLLVARRGTVVYRRSFGFRSLVPEKEPMSVETVFDVASLTKVMATATSIMILVEEGRIALSDPVANYLPCFTRYGKGAITVRQLLTHYSGLRADLDLNQHWSGYDTAISKACSERLVAPAGEEFIYSDINYIVAAELVRKVSGKHLHEFSVQRIFQPLGMDKTQFKPPRKIHNIVAPTEKRDGRILRGQVHDPTAFRMGGSSGHAGLFSTVDDAAIYAQMILNQGTYDGVRILAPLSILAMTTPQSPVAAKEWRGIGFDIRTPFSGSRGDLLPVGSFGHTGFTGTSLWIDPYNELFIILFTNRVHPDGQGNVVSLRKTVASVVAASMLEVPSLRQYYYQNR